MGRQWNTIIESLGPLTGGSMSISANLTDIEALLTTLQADIVDGIIVSSGTVESNVRDGSGNLITSTTSGTKRLLDVSANVSLPSALDANIRDGAGNLITSSSRGSERALSVQIVDASGNQITSFGTANVSVTNGTIAQITSGTINSNLRDGSGNAITSTSLSGKQRLDVTLAGGGTVGSASPTFADLVAGTDGTNLRAFSTDTAGRLNTNINGTVPVSGTVTANNQALTTGTGSISGTSAVGTDLIASTDVSGFAEASVQFNGSWPSNAFVAPQLSNDNSTWITTNVLTISNTSPLVANAFSSTQANTLCRVGLFGARYFRLRVTQVGTNSTYDFAYTLNPRSTNVNVQSVNVSNSLTVTPQVSQNGHNNYHTLISAAGTNAQLVVGTARAIGTITLANTTSSYKYFKLINKSTAPVAGTDTPVLNYPIPPMTTLDLNTSSIAIRMTSGIAYVITGGQALLDTTAIGAGDVVVNITWT